MNEVFCSYQNKNRTLEFTYSNYREVKDNKWLSDQHIDIFMKWVLNTTLTPSQAKQVHVFSAQFYTALKLWNLDPFNEKNIGRIQRATNKADLSEKALVFWPVIEQNHWTLGVVSEKRIIFFDSLMPHNLETPAVYIKNLYKFIGYPLEEVSLIYAKCPQQNNTMDCGIYTIRHADYCMKRFSKNLSIQLPPEKLDMTQCHITRQLLTKVLERWSKRRSNQSSTEKEVDIATRILVDMKANWKRGRGMRKDVEIGQKTYRLTVGRSGIPQIKLL